MLGVGNEVTSLPRRARPRKVLVVDTWFLEASNTLAERDFEKCSKAHGVLSEIFRKCHKVALDTDGMILEEYNRHMQGQFSRIWFRNMQSKGKFQEIDKSNSRYSCVTHAADRKFLQVAEKARTKIVLSEDSHLLDVKRHNEIRRKGIRIADSQEALENIL